MTDFEPTAEPLLVAAMLMDEKARDTAHERGVHPEVFFDRRLAHIIEHMNRMDEVGMPVEVTTLHRSLERAGSPTTISDLTDLLTLLTENGSPNSVHHYADMVIEDYRSRQVWATAARLMETLRTNPKADIQYELAEALKNIMPERMTQRGGWYGDLIPAYIQGIERRWSGEGSPEYLPTGFGSLDHHIRGGLYPGELVTVGARPGIGKTVMALNVAHNIARTGKRVAFFSAEMTAPALLRRAAAEFTGTAAPLTDYFGPLPDKRQEKIRQQYLVSVAKDLADLEVYIDDRPRPTVDVMSDTIERLGNIDILFFDYLSLAGGAAGRNQTEEQRISRLSLDLATLAKNHNIPVVALSQLSRAVEAPTNKPYRPSMSHLRDSGQVEANSNQVWLLYRSKYYVGQGMLEDDGGEDVMGVYISKNRDGDTGYASLRFDGPTFSLKEYQ